MDIIVEFEGNLNLISEVKEAKARLKRYVKELHPKDPRKYWAIANDGTKFLI